MKRSVRLVLALSLTLSQATAQDPTPASLADISPAPTAEPTTTPPPAPLPGLTPQKRGWLSRALNPFGSSRKYKNPKLRGLVLELQVLPETVALSEVRQLEIKVSVTNRSKRAIELDFPTDQRIEIHLLNPAEEILTKWSDNHAVTEKPGSVLINPQEKIEYTENIATRDLTPNKVFTVEVFFPKYPEMRIRHKFLTAP